MLLQPRYGGIGMVALPFFVVFEAAGPLVELCGIVYCVAGLAVGWISAGFGALLLAMEAVA
jgi:hypothetical protein